jgi:hypothetical protein
MSAFIPRAVFDAKEAQHREAEIIAGAAAVAAREPRLSAQRCRDIAGAVLDAVADLRSEPLEPQLSGPAAASSLGAAR